MKRPGFVERLRLAQRVHLEAEAKFARAEMSEPVKGALLSAELPAPIERGPVHTYGIRKVKCADCGEWICRAPGHALHVCRAPEFVDAG